MENATDLRRRTMQAVRGKDTEPERIVRRLVSQLGFGYRLHREDIPGRPDLAFIGCRKVIFVHGCFWHGHNCKRGAREPKANNAYWAKKIAGNKARDRVNAGVLSAMDWHSLVVWECELRNQTRVQQNIASFLSKRNEALATPQQPR